MGDEVEWMLFEDGCLCINESICGITYHPTLNVILIITKESTVKVLDVYSGLVLQNSHICATAKSQVHCVYIPVHDKLLFTDGRSVGLRRDHNGVLLLDTVLQTRVGTASDVVRIELLLSEAIHLLKSLKELDALNSEITDEVRRELESKVSQKEAQTKSNHKVSKWSTVCLELPHNVLKSVCGALVQEFKRLNRYVPSLSIASAVGERLSYLVPPLSVSDAAPTSSGSSASAAVDRSLMFSEAARRETFGKWPHMNYKWALPDQMAQAGFYHQANSAGDDRAMCFTCNICLVCWEPTDEPWSEHERHSPSCPFVKGEYTQNVPLSVTHASGSAVHHSDRIDKFTFVSTSSFPDLVATATENGNVVVWNVVKTLKKEFQFTVDLLEPAIVLAAESRRRRLFDLAENDIGESDSRTGRNILSKHGVKLKRSNLDGVTRSRYGALDSLNVTSMAVVCSAESCYSLEEVSECEGTDGPIKPPSLVVGCSIRGSIARCCSSARCVGEDNPLVQAKNDVNQAGCAVRSLDIMSLEDEVEEDGEIGNVSSSRFDERPSSPPFPSSSSTSGLYLLIYSLGSRRLPRVITGCVGAEASSRRTSGTRQDNGGCLFNMSLGALLDDNILVDSYGMNPYDSPPKIPNANDIQLGFSCPMHQTGGEENGSLGFPELSETIVDNTPVVRKAKVDKKECQYGVRLVNCLELPLDFCGEMHRVTHIVPTADDRHLLVVVGRTEVDESESGAVGCLFLYRLTAVGDYTTLGEVPIVTRTLGKVITRVVLLPSEVGDGREDSPPTVKLSKSPAGNASLGYAAVITSCGRIEIVKISTLEMVGNMEPPSGDSFVSLAYCTSMERLCCSTLNGQLLLLQLWPKVVDARLANDGTCQFSSVAIDGVEHATNTTVNGPKDHDVGHLLVDRSLTAGVLSSLHELTQFTNLMPRFAATLPTCWTEIQQEQKQRRHPQHLQQQGEGQQHTRSWRLQCDNTTWDEHLLELTLPRPCSIGHIDLKFNLQPVFVSPPNIQVTLLKQNTCGICKMQDSPLSGNRSIDTSGSTVPGTNGSSKRQEQQGKSLNPVVLPEFQEAHNAEILCGPLSLETRIDLSGQSGIVTFTSPELIKTKARTFLVHIKSLDGDKERSERSSESSARSSVNVAKPFGRHSNAKLKDKHGPVPSLQTLLEHTFQEYIPPKSAAEILAATAPGRKIDVPRGCNVLYEISITVRTSQKCPNIGKEREQRVAMLENFSFQERLVSILCGGDNLPTDITLEHRQHLVFDILNWIASIQSNGITLRANVKRSVFAIIQSNLNSLIQTCFLNGSRSISHKASKLIVLCTEFYKEIKDPSFELSLMKALLNSLPMMVTCRSAGSMHWFFLLLDSVKFADAASVSRECFSLLVSVVEELDRRSHPTHGLLRARFGLYRNPFELELFEVEATQPPKPTSTPITYAAVVGNGGSASTSNNNNNNGTPGVGMHAVSSSTSQMASGCHPKAFGSVGSSFLSEDGPGTQTSFNHPAQQLQGLLEVEPLHFVCNSASDGTKVERVDQGPGSSVNPSSLANNNMTVYVPTAYDSSQISMVLKDMKKTEEELLKVLQQKQSIILQQSSASSAPYGTSSQLSSKLTNAASVSNPGPPFASSSKQSPSTPISGLSVVPTCFQHFLQPPPQQVLVIERMHSGARRFVVLDFGKPVVLTDLIIPACPDLVSLSIDIWTKGEEEDGRRLVVSTDIFFRSLVMSDLLPPPICRYLKITAIGRYGMSTTRCRIPLGSFYGLTTLPPWVDADEGEQSLSEAESRNQLNMLSTFLEDVHCRYSLACDKLRSLLAPLLSYNRSTAGHIQAFVRGEREGTSGDEQRIYSAYRDCVQMQQQFGLISSTAERLQRWRTLPSTNPVPLSPDPRHACTNKLGVLSECLLVALLGMSFKSTCPTGSDLASSNILLPNLNEGMCKLLFRHLATVGSRRFQAMATALLVRTCGLCPWWGDFIAQLFVELYSSNQTAIFPQDRVFLLLVSRHDKSLLWNTMPSILELLEKLLAPILDSGNRSFGSVDLPLVGWVLLFISFYLDLAEGSGSTCSLTDDGADIASSRASAPKDKEGVSSRWDFIQEEWALLRNQSNQTKMASSRFYRKKLQKRLMYHKQQLEDLEQTKKEFIPSATFSMLKSHFGAKVAVDLNAAIKQQEQLFKKMLKQHTAKHFKDVVQIRRLEGGNLSRLVGEGSNASGGPVAGPSWEQDEGVDLKEPPLPLHRTQSLKVARGLAALLLCMDYTCNVDMFLLSCKILARIATLARPAIGLGEILSQSELQKLLWRSIGYQRAAGTPSWGGPWAGHAITCLLQDILEGERMFPIVGSAAIGNLSAGCSGASCGSPLSSAAIPSDLSDIPPGSSADDSSIQFDGESNLVGLEKLLEVESDETSSDETPLDCNESTPKYSFAKKVSADANKSFYYKSGGSAGFNALQDGLITVPCGANANKLSVTTVSSAIDSRLEMGVEVVAELRLKTMAFFESDAFFSALFYPLLPPNERPSQPVTIKPDFSGFVHSSPFSSTSTPYFTSSSADMLCICFDNLFWQAKMPGVSLESLLQLWVSLNNETSSDPTTQILHLSANAASGLLDALAWYPTLSLRTWYLAFKVLLPFGGHQSSNVDIPSHSASESSAKAIASSDVLLPVIVKFLSGTGLEYVSGTKLNVGPNVSGVVCDFLVRLMKNCHSLPSGFRAGVHLKEQLLRIVYLLLANNGPLRCGQGPLDAQCRFINLLLTVNFDCVDPHLQTSIVEAIASLVHFHVHTGRQVTCRSSTESTVGDGTCFGGLFSVPLRNDLAGCSMEGTRSNLVHSLLSLCVRLVQTPCGKSPAANPPSSFLTDTVKMEQRSSFSSMNERGELSEPLQTDELKSSCPQVSSCGHTHALSSHPKPQYVAEDVLQHQPTMMFLLSTLASCTGSTMAMILGPVGIGSSNLQQDGADRFVLGEPASVGDVVFQLLVTLNSKASELSSILRPVLAFLSCESVELDGRPKTSVTLSEPLLWFLIKILDCKQSLAEFLSLGGVEVVCRNLVSSYSTQVNCHPSLLSVIMQKMNRLMAPIVKGQWPNTDNVDGLINFAPLGTITSKDPTTMQPADILIQPTPPHRRARTPAWSYHFYPEDSWVELTITLPCAILLHEVHIQPHLTSLATCPSAVSLEVSADGFSRPKPLCPPHPTGGLTFIRLQLSRPEVTTSLMIRLYKPRDSSNVGLSQILLLGSSAFGEAVTRSSSLIVPTEESVAKSCIGWLRILHHCLVHQCDMDVLANMCQVAAGVPGLLHTCCSLLTSPAPELYATHIESVLLTLGRHNARVGLQVINILLHTGGSPFRQGNCSWLMDRSQGGWSSVDSATDIIHLLCTTMDSDMIERVRALLNWLQLTTRAAIQHFKSRASTESNGSDPEEFGGVSTQAFVHCVAVTLWSLREAGFGSELEVMLDIDLFRNLYDWSAQLGSTSSTKWAVDAVLTSICHVCPHYFPALLEWMGFSVPPTTQEDAPITDDSKKEITNNQATVSPGTPLSYEMIDLNSISSECLATVAAASQSSFVVEQLIRSRLPGTLAQAILDFCVYVGTAIGSRSSFDNNSSLVDHMTDSDKAGRSCNSNSFGGVGVVVTASVVSSILNFFTEACGEGTIRDWLGGPEGSIFWLPLVDLLCQPLSRLSGPSCQQTLGLTAQQRASLEAATIQFLSRCCWCHSDNQQLLAQVLCKVIGKQGVSGNQGGLGGLPSISGFARRLILQLLLENEKILVCVKSSLPLNGQLLSGCHWRHPRFGCGHRYRLLYASTQITCSDLIASASSDSTASMSIMTESGEATEAPRDDLGSIGLDLADYLSVAAGVLAKDKRHKETKGANQSMMFHPSVRGGQHAPNSFSSLPLSTMALVHDMFPDHPLPRDLTLAQLLSALEDKGQSLLSPHIILTLQSQNQSKVPTEAYSEPAQGVADVSKLLMGYSGFPSVLQVFASVGGLALMAQYLPVLYPDVNRISLASSVGKANGCDDKATGLCDVASNLEADWVKVEGPDDILDDFPDLMPLGGSTARSLHATSMPPHSLAAFGLFLRLPGYADTLLRERQKALCLLRLALGVCDDGEGGDIFSSSVAPSLPTFPFQVLQRLFDSTPLTTDDGLLLRRMALDVGAIHLLLACLSILSHQNVDVSLPTPQHEVLLAATRCGVTPQDSQAKSDDKSHLYWAKGTGFGTGSTAQSWDVEQAIMRQKSEEEHVTCLLLVLASFINPGGNIPDIFSNSGTDCDDDEIWLDEDDEDSKTNDSQPHLLPSVFPELLAQSCLFASISSYLRNDSVLDMARHVPLYRALLLLLRALAVCNQLVGLLLPRLGRKSESDASGSMSVCCLLTKMKSCVDTYASRLRVNNKSKGTSGSRGGGGTGGSGGSSGLGVGKSIMRVYSKTREEEEESEGLALLIPDIQETARIVKFATERLVVDGVDATDESGTSDRVDGLSIDRRFQKSIEDRYIEAMRRLQFDTFEMIVEDEDGTRFTIPHHFESNMRATGDHGHPSRARRLAQETVTLSTSLPLSYSSSVFVRCDQDRLDLMKVLITGPAETPYANGCFEFDVYFPPDYPNSPMLINLETTGHHTVRFNPNLYNDGKVCLSILNTWHGRPEEKWNSQTSSFLQVLVSIQSLILVPEPYFNEPGYERSRGTPSGQQSSREYDSNIRQATVKWAMLEQLRNPCPSFKEVVRQHFWMKRSEISEQCETWINEMEAQGRDRRTGRTVALNCQALKRHYSLLKEEFSRMKPPSGMEDIVGNVNWTKPPSPEDGGGATALDVLGAGGPSGAEVVIAEFAQLVDKIDDSDSTSSSQENGNASIHHTSQGPTASSYFCEPV